MVQLSIGISGSKTLGEYIELAQLIEGYGFHTLSIFDDLMFKPAWPILFVIAQNTERIRIGPSISNPYLIHPAILAGNVAMLDEMSDGRAYFGIGRGAFLDFLKQETPRPITTVRESIEMVKRLLRGDATPYEGKVFQATDAATLQWKPLRSDVPVMVGTWGRKMCRMAGGIADEVKAGSMWSAAYGRHMWGHISAGALAAGRDPDDVQLVFGPLTSIAEDRAEAEAYARRTLAFYLPYLAPMPEFVGVDPEEVARVQAATSRGDIDEATALVSDECLNNFALFGTPSDCIEQIEAMVDATNVGRIEFGMPHGPSGSAEAVRLLGKYVLPQFQK